MQIQPILLMLMSINEVNITHNGVHIKSHYLLNAIEIIVITDNDKQKHSLTNQCPSQGKYLT